VVIDFYKHQCKELAMKASNSDNYSGTQCELELAFEEGYRLGRDDAKEGIFIDPKRVAEQYRFNTLTYKFSI
jgi:hypothetical protein